MEDGSTNPASERLPRRLFIKSTGALGAAGLGITAGCMGGESTDETTTSGGNDTTTTSSDDDSEMEPQQGGTLNWGAPQHIIGLDPHKVHGAADGRVKHLILDGLTRPNWNKEVKPHMAKGWEVSDDRLTFTFTLRDGLTFHNGKTLTAADAKASFERGTMANNAANAWAGRFESFEAPDDKTLVVNLAKPWSGFLYWLSTRWGLIIPEELAQAGEKEISVDNIVGSGPFKLESWEQNSSMTLLRHDDYWRENLPYVDKLIRTDFTENSARYNSIRAGNQDLINAIPFSKIPSAKEDPNINVSGVTNSVITYTFNCHEPPFDDPKARLAMDYACDQKTLMEAATFGHGQAGGQPLPKSSPFYFEDIPSPRPRDLDKAKAALDSAAQSEFDFTIKVGVEFTDQVRSCKTFASQVNEIDGINCTVETMPFSNWIQEVFVNKNYGIGAVGYEGCWYPEYAYFRFSHPKGPWYLGGWKNDDYITAVDNAMQTYDVEEQREYYKEAMTVMHEQPGASLFPYWTNLSIASRTYVKGKMGSPEGNVLRLEDNWLAK